MHRYHGCESHVSWEHDVQGLAYGRGAFWLMQGPRHDRPRKATHKAPSHRSPRLAIARASPPPRRRRRRGVAALPPRAPQKTSLFLFLGLLLLLLLLLPAGSEKKKFTLWHALSVQSEVGVSHRNSEVSTLNKQKHRVTSFRLLGGVRHEHAFQAWIEGRGFPAL